MRTICLRLTPGQDLKHELDRLVSENALNGAFVITCVGSLTRAVLRLANQPGTVTFDGHFEIVSLTGTMAINGAHYHIAISDEHGVTHGGHLWDGSLIYTTAEIVIGVPENVQFVREIDPQTTYDELVVKPLE